MPYITSTATSGTDYAVYRRTESGVFVTEKVISIKGGANCMDKKLYATPEAVATKVTDEELELLMQNPEFQRHMKAGFLKVTKIMKEETNKGLEVEDKSAPMTPKKYEKRGKKAPKTKLED